MWKWTTKKTSQGMLCFMVSRSEKSHNVLIHLETLLSTPTTISVEALCCPSLEDGSTQTETGPNLVVSGEALIKDLRKEVNITEENSLVGR